jgi:outer membrane protein TolC
MKKIVHLLLLFTVTSLQAQTHFQSLEQCIAYAREHNASLLSERFNAAISHERVKSAWAGILPQIKAFGTFDNNISLPVQLVPAQLLGGPEGEYAKVQFGTRYSATYGAEASLPLINVSNWKNIQSAQHAEKVSEHQIADKDLTLTEQLATAYYMALLSREASILNEELVNASDSLLDAAIVRLSNGMIEPLEYNRVKAVHLESQQQLQESQALYQKNIDALKSLSEINIADTLILSENIADVIKANNTPTSLAITSADMPRYKMLLQRRLLTREDLKKQRSKTLPELSLYARYAQQTFSNQTNVFANDSWFDVGVVGLRAEWTLFTGLNRQSSIQQASLQSKIAEQELQSYTLQADKELEDLRINHQVAIEGVTRYSEHYQLNAMNLNIAGEKYNQGIYSIDQYITIYQERVRSQNQYLSKLANYFIYDSLVTMRNALQ